MYHGLFNSPATLPLLSNAVTRSLSPENVTGSKGEGARATDGTGGRAARNLGKGWKVNPCLEVQPHATRVIADIKGPGAIQSMWVGGYVGRGFIIRFYWDDSENPSVECPLSDFFAAGWYDNGLNANPSPFSQLQSMMICVNPNRGLNCFWNMPFKKHCVITLENRTDGVLQTFYQINYVLTEVPEEIGYFHAQFRLSAPLQEKQDHVILDGVTGKGHYVGTALSVGLNGPGQWWGEGEVKFFLDGDGADPTICGTGTEDYFEGSYNWDVDGQYREFCTPYAGMYYVYRPDGTYNSQQRFSMYHWHVVDPIRFENDIRVTIQDLGWYKDGTYRPRRDDFASVAYWYQTLPAAPFPALPDPYAMMIN